MAVEWIYKCGSEWKYCEDGLCQRYLELKEQPNTYPNPTMEKEWKEKTGTDWKGNSISNRFHHLTNPFTRQKTLVQITKIKRFIENDETLNLFDQQQLLLLVKLARQGKYGAPW